MESRLRDPVYRDLAWTTYWPRRCTRSADERRAASDAPTARP